MGKDSKLKKTIIEDIGEIMPERDEEALENIADDILDLTAGIEDEERIRKLVLGELIFISEKSGKRIIDLSEDLANKIISHKM